MTYAYEGRHVSRRNWDSTTPPDYQPRHLAYTPPTHTFVVTTKEAWLAIVALKVYNGLAPLGSGKELSQRLVRQLVRELQKSLKEGS